MSHKEHENNFDLGINNTSIARDTSSDSEPPSAAAHPLRRNNKMPPLVLCEKKSGITS
jgi:hypothetical protein